MRALSASTTVTDPYRAGVLLGEALEPVGPEAVLLFSSIHPVELGRELLEGLHDVLGEGPVVGNTGDGVYETRQVAPIGAAALGLNSGGAVHWASAEASGALADPAGCLRLALRRLEEASGGARPALVFLAADFRADGSVLESVLQRELDAPAVGGLAGDEYRFERCLQYRGREALRDSVVLLGAYGPLAFDIQVGTRLRRVGAPGLITRASGSRVQAIDGLPAMDFILRETGKPALETDRGVVSIVVGDPDRPGVERIRSILPGVDLETGELGLFGKAEAGATVQVCLAAPEDLIAEVYALASSARERIEPRAALVVSCAGRKELLAGQISHEIGALADAFPEGLPLVGFPSFGEFGPRREGGGYSPTLFHNMTYVLVLFGEPR